MTAQPALAPCEYKTGRVLGQGSYATVKEAIHIKTQKRYAVKVISKRLMQGREHMILNEIEVLKKISKGHHNIVTLWDYFETPNNLYLVMDLCTGGELFDRICEKGSFYEEDAAEIVKIVVDAVAYLHDQNIVHRDIKPENLLFRSKESLNDLVIADFGLSKMIDPAKYDLLMTTCGTPGYMAPEVLKKTGHGKSVDMWSIGVLAYFLLCGYTPFDSQNNADEMQKILSGNYRFEPEEFWMDVSEDAKDFIRKLLVVDASKRLSAKEALQHPWIKHVGADRAAAVDILPKVRERFNARQSWKKAGAAVRAVNLLSHPTNGNTKGSATNLAEFRPKEDAMVDGQLMVLARP
ncbi:hypothetical protein HK102_011505 [Quaeritorhiza haematococci]|nr:hypothetical protein HK102_011505 [Quaeritorhiza haematococci]